MASKKKKGQVINLIVEVKDLNFENYKTLMKEIEDDTPPPAKKNGKMSCVHQLEDG